MTSSLVGSEMCIRDRANMETQREGHHRITSQTTLRSCSTQQLKNTASQDIAKNSMWTDRRTLLRH
eukprot:9687441-Prorocentrum_lima.AAC.1